MLEWFHFQIATGSLKDRESSMDGASGKELQSQGGEFIHPFFMREYFSSFNAGWLEMECDFFIKNALPFENKDYDGILLQAKKNLSFYD